MINASYLTIVMCGQNLNALHLLLGPAIIKGLLAAWQIRRKRRAASLLTLGFKLGDFLADLSLNPPREGRSILLSELLPVRLRLGAQCDVGSGPDSSDLLRFHHVRVMCAQFQRGRNNNSFCAHIVVALCAHFRHKGSSLESSLMTSPSATEGYASGKKRTNLSLDKKLVADAQKIFRKTPYKSLSGFVEAKIRSEITKRERAKLAAARKADK